MSFTVSFDERLHWQRILADRNRPQKPARRAHIIPRTDQDPGVKAIARADGKAGETAAMHAQRSTAAAALCR